MAASIVGSPSVLEEGHIAVTTDINVTSDAANSVEREEYKKGKSTAKVKAKKEKKEVSSADRAAWVYLKCALMFFTAMIVTWVCLPPFPLISFLRTISPRLHTSPS